MDQSNFGNKQRFDEEEGLSQKMESNNCGFGKMEGRSPVSRISKDHEITRSREGMEEWKR